MSVFYHSLLINTRPPADLFHKPCLDQICDALPTHTAAAGYACPTCHLAIIPPAKDVGPLARRIRESFAASTWAKPLLSIEVRCCDAARFVLLTAVVRVGGTFATGQCCRCCHSVPRGSTERVDSQ